MRIIDRRISSPSFSQSKGIETLYFFLVEGLAFRNALYVVLMDVANTRVEAADKARIHVFHQQSGGRCC